MARVIDTFRRSPSRRRAIARKAGGFLFATLAWWAVGGGARGAEPPPLSAAIDAEIEADLAKHGLTPAPRAEAGELARRLYLDVIGRPPTRAEIEAHLAEPGDDKHHRLIERLLADREMAVHWARVLHNWLNGALPEQQFGHEEFVAYLRAALEKNRPWNDIARDLLLPEQAGAERRGAAYFLSARLRGGDKEAKLDGAATAVASGLFGVQLQCAKCHDHPLVEQWKQDHYYGLAAYFARTEEKRVDNQTTFEERKDGEVKFTTRAQVEKTAPPMFFDGHSPDAAAPHRRKALVEHAITPGNAYFKRAIVNRVWRKLMGRGLVEPIDQMHAENPATHPKLLETLAEEFAASGFDLRALMAAILRSEAYARSSQWTRGPRPPEIRYAAAVVKPLSADQLAHALALASGYFEVFRAKLEREKANRKLTDIDLATIRAQFEREREFTQFGERFRHDGEAFEANVAQALFFTYGQLARGQLENRAPTSLATRLAKARDSAEATREAFWTLLSRPPAPEELELFSRHWAGSEPKETLVRDALWALVSSPEFRFTP